MTEAERQARFRSRMRALAETPERLSSGNYRDICADCGQIMVARSPAELDGARCACPPQRFEYVLELVCSLCSREIASARVPTPRSRVVLLRPVRCQVCGGVAVQGDVTVVRVPQPVKRWAPLKRGRPPGRRQDLRRSA